MSTLSRLTDMLRVHKESLVRHWADRLRGDPKIPQAHGLGEEDLRDHIPDLLDELGDLLAAPTRAGEPTGPTGLDIGSTEAVELHAEHRRAHGYTLAEELREMAHLRAVFLELVTREGIALEGDEAALVHSTFDAVMITAAVELEQATTASLRQDVATRELFSAVLGHDLRNPLGVVAASAERAQKVEGLPPEVSGALQRIAGSTARMTRLVEDLLDMARIRAQGGRIPIARKPCELRAVCEGAIADIQLVRACHPIRLEAPARVDGEWDPDRIKQLVTNLLNNALDFSRPDDPIDVTLRAGGQAAEIAVHNLGPSIAPELLPVVFDPFLRGEQGARAAGGLGLGLFVVREIAAAHGGEAQVTSTPGEGTTFRVSLPRAHA